MRRADVRRAILCLSLFTYLATAIAAAPGVVLCVGPDGHCAIEFTRDVPACGGCLDGDTSAAPGEVPAPIASAPPACPCIDIPIGLPSTAAARAASVLAVAKDASPHPVAPSARALARFATDARPGPARDRFPARSPAATDLVRSVVFRI